MTVFRFAASAAVAFAAAQAQVGGGDTGSGPAGEAPPYAPQIE